MSQMMDKKTKESFERLKNQLEQARLDGDTILVKHITSIIKRLEVNKK